MHIANIFDNHFFNIICLYFIPAGISLGLLVYSMFAMPSNRVNNSFSIFVLLIASWQSIEGIMRCTDNPVKIENWFKTSSIIALFIIPFGIVFTLNLYKSNKRRSFSKLFLGLFIPTLLISFYVHNSEGLVKLTPSKIFYYGINPSMHPANLVSYFWLTIIGLLMFIILGRRYFKSGQNKTQKSQSLILSIGFLIPLVLGVIFELLFPFLFKVEVVPITTTAFCGFSLAAIIAIKKFSLLDFSPINHMDLIMDSLDESLLIINKYDQIMYANESFCQMVNKSFNELKDIHAYDLFLETNSGNSLNSLIEKKASNHIRLRSDTNESIWLMFNSSHYKDNLDNNIGQIVLFTNINTIKIAKQNLADERQKLKMAIEAVKMATFEIDLHQGNISFSDNIISLIGIDSPYAAFDKVFEDVRLNGRHLNIQNLLSMVLDRLQMDIHFDYKRPDDGQVIHLEMKGSVVYDKTSTNISIKGVIVDVTEKWTTEEELNHRSELLNAIFENEPECVMVMSLNGELLEINPAGSTLLEADSKEDIFTRELTGFVHPLDKELYASQFEKVCKGQVTRFEFRIITFHNKIKWVESHLVPLKAKDGTIQSVLNVTRNINDIKLKTEELMEMTRILEKSESRLKQAQEIAHMGSWQVNLIDGSTIWTDEAYRIFGIEPGNHNLSMDQWTSFIHPNDKEMVRTQIDQARLTQTGNTMHFRIMRTDGQVRYVVSSFKFEFDIIKRPVFLVGIVLDVTESKLSEIRLRRLLEVTEKQNQSLQNFAYIVSHNIRSHSANISGLAELLEADHPGDSLTWMLKSSADKLSETIGNLNSIITIQNQANKHYKNINLYDILINTIESINRLVQESGAHINIDLDRTFTIKGVPSYVESIFLNLITNSIKYRQPDSPLKIDIKMRLEDDYAIVTICDNGIGIDLEKHGKNVFGLYKTFHSNLDAKGLGLYISKNQIEAMNGKIEVQSQLGKGSCFSVYFNLLDVEEEYIHESINYPSVS